MNNQTAERVADVIIAAALLGAAIVVVRTPALRRLAWGAATTAIAATLPAWIGREVREAWDVSGPAVR